MDRTLEPRLSVSALTLTLGLCSIQCSTARAAEPLIDSGTAPGVPVPVQLTMHEVAKQVTVAEYGTLLRLDGPAPAAGAGSTLLLNSDVVEGGELVEGGIPTVRGGTVLGTMHGLCTHVGGELSLVPGGDPGRIAKCEQAIHLTDRGQIIVSGLIQQEAFEAGVTQVLAVTGGTGEFQGIYGELKVTQLTFPGIVKRLELTARIPAS